MKLTIAKTDLQTALKAVSASKSSTGSDISSHYLFKVFNPPDASGDAQVEIAAYSGQTFASAPIPGVTVEGADADGFTIEGWRLEKWLLPIPEDKVLTFTYTPQESKAVEARAARAAQQFNSLDPSKFPSWEKSFAKSTVTATMPASLLYSILNYAKDFVSDDDTKHPEQTVVECRKKKITLPKKNPNDKDEKPAEIDVGVVYAMDGMHAVQIRCPALKDSTFRIHGKDLKGIVSFLASIKEYPVELLEDIPPKDAPPGSEPTTLILRQLRTDEKPTSFYGENRFTTPFPSLGLPGSTDHYLWTLPKEEVTGWVITNCEAGAENKDTKLRIVREGDVIKMAIKNPPPSSAWIPYEITTDPEVKVTDLDPEAADPPALAADGFMVNKNSFRAALKSMPGDNPRFGVNKLGRGGYLRFVREEGPNGEILTEGKLDGVEVKVEDRTTYLTVVAWVR